MPDRPTAHEGPGWPAKTKTPRPFGRGAFAKHALSLATLAATATFRDEAFALRPLAGQLARTANGFSLLASLLLRRLFIMIAALHLAESTFPLHLLFQRAERLLHIIVAHNDLYDGSLSICLDARTILTPLVRQRRGYYQSCDAVSTLSAHTAVVTARGERSRQGA